MRNEKVNHKVLKQEGVDRMRLDVETGESIQRYGLKIFPLDENYLLDNNLFSQSLPTLRMPPTISSRRAKYDFHNARLIHQSFPEIPYVVASDSRLWTFFCHCDSFFNYIAKRHPLPGELTFDDYPKLNNEQKKTIRNHIITWYFTSARDRTLRRNALARLWWVAELTHAPWHHDSDGFFDNLADYDEYHFTKILSETDIQSQLLERAYGKNRRILITMLEIIDEKNMVRTEWRLFAKRVSAVLAYRSFNDMSYSELKSELSVQAS